MHNENLNISIPQTSSKGFYSFDLSTLSKESNVNGVYSIVIRENKDDIYPLYVITANFIPIEIETKYLFNIEDTSKNYTITFKTMDCKPKALTLETENYNPSCVYLLPRGVFQYITDGKMKP